MTAIIKRIGDVLAAIGDRILSEPVLDVALVSDVLVILAAVRAHQPISDAVILDAVQTLLALFARSKVTPNRSLPAKPAA